MEIGTYSGYDKASGIPDGSKFLQLHLCNLLVLWTSLVIIFCVRIYRFVASWCSLVWNICAKMSWSNLHVTSLSLWIGQCRRHTRGFIFHNRCHHFGFLIFVIFSLTKKLCSCYEWHIRYYKSLIFQSSSTLHFSLVPLEVDPRYLQLTDSSWILWAGIVTLQAINHPFCPCTWTPTLVSDCRGKPGKIGE